MLLTAWETEYSGSGKDTLFISFTGGLLRVTHLYAMWFHHIALVSNVFRCQLWKIVVRTVRYMDPFKGSGKSSFEWAVAQSESG